MSTDHAEDDADVMQQDDAYDESHMDEEVNYDEGEPEADDDGDAYESDSEVDELVDEIDESDKPPETNRRARRAPLRCEIDAQEYIIKFFAASCIYSNVSTLYTKSRIAR